MVSLRYGHLSLASHELVGRPELADEVEAYVRELAVPLPRTFPGQTASVYRLKHPTWTGPWWTTFRGARLRSFHLAAVGMGV